jgi:hypothetical protein
VGAAASWSTTAEEEQEAANHVAEGEKKEPEVGKCEFFVPRVERDTFSLSLRAKSANKVSYARARALKPYGGGTCLHDPPGLFGAVAQNRRYLSSSVKTSQKNKPVLPRTHVKPKSQTASPVRRKPCSHGESSPGAVQNNRRNTNRRNTKMSSFTASDSDLKKCESQNIRVLAKKSH